MDTLFRPDISPSMDVGVGAAIAPAVRMENHWLAECWRPSSDGSTRRNLAWREEFDNLVVTAGLNKLLDATFKTGLATPAWYCGLVDNASFSSYVGADTMASHAGWVEATLYSNTQRPTWTPGSVSAGSVDNSASKAVFNVNSSGTVRGAFIADSSNKSSTTGTLYGEGDFSLARSVLIGDTINLTVTITATTA